MPEPISASMMAAMAAIQAAGSIGGGYLAGRNSGQETKIQKRQRKLIDQLLTSLDGQGPYSDLYNFDESVFNSSFKEPALAMFRNQISPQIQQQFIASGQQRGTGLDDQILRAGVDLDQLLNTHMASMKENAMNRKQNTINSILGGGAGGTQGMGAGQAFGQAASGYLSSDAFSDAVSGIFKNQPGSQNANTTAPPVGRRGFELEGKDWKVGDPRWNQSGGY